MLVICKFEEMMGEKETVIAILKVSFTLSQTTDFRLFQTKRVCRQNF